MSLFSLWHLKVKFLFCCPSSRWCTPTLPSIEPTYREKIVNAWQYQQNNLLEFSEYTAKIWPKVIITTPRKLEMACKSHQKLYKLKEKKALMVSEFVYEQNKYCKGKHRYKTLSVGTRWLYLDKYLNRPQHCHLIGST